MDIASQSVWELLCFLAFWTIFAYRIKLRLASLEVFLAAGGCFLFVLAVALENGLPYHGIAVDEIAVLSEMELVERMEEIDFWVEAKTTLLYGLAAFLFSSSIYLGKRYSPKLGLMEQLIRRA